MFVRVYLEESGEKRVGRREKRVGRREWGEESGEKREKRKEKRENRKKRRLQECRQSAVVYSCIKTAPKMLSL